MKIFVRTLSVAASLILLASAYGQELRGAEAALRDAAKARGSSVKDGSGQSGLLQAITDFPRAARTMTAPAAAAQWLVLFDSYRKAQSDGQVQFSTLIGALPSPDSWNLIAAGLHQRASVTKSIYSASLSLFADLLKGDAAEQIRDADALLPYHAQKIMGNSIGAQILDVESQIAIRTGDKSRLTRVLTLEIATTATRGENTLQVPDLVRLLGAESAQKLFLLAFTDVDKIPRSVGGSPNTGHGSEHCVNQRQTSQSGSMVAG